MYIRVNMRCRNCGQPGSPCKFYFEKDASLKQISDQVVHNLKNILGYHQCSCEEFGITEPVSFEKMDDRCKCPPCHSNVEM